MPDWLPSIEIVVAVPLVAALIYHFYFRARYDLCIRIRGDDVTVIGRLPPARATLLRNFFRHDFGSRKRMKVLIKVRRNRTYLLRFSPKVSAGEAQQVRNFLYTHL